MVLKGFSARLRSLGSGTGPQTPAPLGAASCGHTVRVNHQGQPLSRAISAPALAA